MNPSANGYRLPTRDEWVYIASEALKADYLYSGSDRIEEVAWYLGNSNSHAYEVKTKKSNALGIYDMTGNVLEWNWDKSSSNSNRYTSGGCCITNNYLCGINICDENCSPVWRTYDYNYFGFRVVRTVTAD